MLAHACRRNCPYVYIRYLKALSPVVAVVVVAAVVVALLVAHRLIQSAVSREAPLSLERKYTFATIASTRPRWLFFSPKIQLLGASAS